MPSTRSIALSTVALLAATGVIALNYRSIRRFLFRRRRTLTRQETLEVLSEISSRYFQVLLEASQAVQRADMIASQRGNAAERLGMTEPEMHGLLLGGGVGEALRLAQASILNSSDVLDDELQTATETFSDDPEITAFLASLDRMMFTYLDGGVPVPFDLSIKISDEQLVAILREVMEAKSEKLAKLLQDKGTESLPEPQTVAEMSRISAEVEEAVCQKHDLTRTQLQGILAKGTNESHSFRKSLMGLLFAHQTIPRFVEQ